METKNGKIVTLSVAFAVYNEERNLIRSLSSVRRIADEIVVVDGGSTDRTVEIAESFGAKIIQTDNPSIFHINKQKALDHCTSEWILQLDADEEVSPQLADEIQKTLAMNESELEKRVIPQEKGRLFFRHEARVLHRDGTRETRGQIVGFYLPRKNEFLGHVITHAGTYPDGVIRLFRRGKGRFPARSVHEQIEIDGRVAWLVNDLIHHSNPTLTVYRKGADRYTGRVADELKKTYQTGTPGLGVRYLILLPLTTFVSLFLRHKGFLDGWWGFLFCFFSSLHFPIAYMKFLKRK